MAELPLLFALCVIWFGLGWVCHKIVANRREIKAMEADLERTRRERDGLYGRGLLK